jgi:hypothetical protein
VPLDRIGDQRRNDAVAARLGPGRRGIRNSLEARGQRPDASPLRQNHAVPGEVAALYCEASRVIGEVAMREAWELVIAGPEDADRSVLLLPGGANAARSYQLVMADEALSGVRLVATTLPGMAGAPLTDDVSVPGMARAAAELATTQGCDVLVGFSHGANVALEMLLSGAFQGPVVLLGISMTTESEAAFFRGAVRMSQKVGAWPMGILLRLVPLMARSAKIPQPHKRELVEDLKQNRARDSVRVSGEYLDYIAADRDYAAELTASGCPVWVVHAEKGDGGLTDPERATLEAAANVTLGTIPGSVFLLPDEAPEQVATVIATAVSTLT